MRTACISVCSMYQYIWLLAHQQGCGLQVKHTNSEGDTHLTLPPIFCLQEPGSYRSYHQFARALPVIRQAMPSAAWYSDKPSCNEQASYLLIECTWLSPSPFPPLLSTPDQHEHVYGNLSLCRCLQANGSTQQGCVCGVQVCLRQHDAFWCCLVAMSRCECEAQVSCEPEARVSWPYSCPLSHVVSQVT